LVGWRLVGWLVGWVGRRILLGLVLCWIHSTRRSSLRMNYRPTPGTSGGQIPPQSPGYQVLLRDALLRKQTIVVVGGGTG
jgi:hypothetical protein